MFLKPNCMKKLLPIMALSVLMTGCANSPYHDPNDPYESYNRTVYQVNDTFYTYIANPVNNAYTAVTPEFFRTGVTNAFNNVGTVPDMINDALQWNWRYFVKDTARLVLNTTLGLFGLIDVAGAAGIPSHQQSFSYTLATWGWSNSNYFMIPFLGPSTVSGAVSVLPNYFMSPLTYVHGGNWQYALWSFDGLQTISNELPAYNAVNEVALDPYIAIRNAYMQNRQYVLAQIKTDGQAPTSTSATSPVISAENINAPTTATTASTPSDASQVSPILLEQMSQS